MKKHLIITLLIITLIFGTDCGMIMRTFENDKPNVSGDLTNGSLDVYRDLPGVDEPEEIATISGEEVSVDPSDVVNFVDVKPSSYYYKAVLWAVNHDPQITKGTSDTTFSPEDTCTRGQAVTFLWRACGCEKVTDVENPFTDVKSSDYFYDAVLWAYKNKITTGTTTTTFGPDETCNRGQIVTFLWRSQGEPASDATISFTDVADDAYFYTPVRWAVEKQITKGTTDQTFSPNDSCTRGQIVTFLYRADQAENHSGPSMLQMRIGDTAVNVEWEENESVRALKELCSETPLSIQMSMYGGFEQVGPIGASLPRNDQQTTTGAGDIVLYSGNQIVVFYGNNSWAYTRLGHITDQDAEGMTRLLGNGNVTITISMEPANTADWSSDARLFMFRP